MYFRGLRCPTLPLRYEFDRTARQLLRKLDALLEQMPAAQITVKTLAGTLGMSERTLACKVRDETGFAVGTYAMRLKLSQVGERVSLTSVLVSTISIELGFSSDSNMRCMLKELIGLTPTKYRQKFG